MYSQRENNPHFLPLQSPRHQPPAQQHDSHFLPLQPPRDEPAQTLESQQHDFSLEMPTRPRSQKQNKRARPKTAVRAPPPTNSLPQHHNQPPQTHENNDHFIIAPTPPPNRSKPHQQPPMHSDQPVHPPHQSPMLSDHQVRRIPRPRKTKPFTWCIAILCALFWIVIILGGLIVLIVYLVFHPKSPKFDVAEASLNAVYLDMGYLLNADVTLIANFTNPNKKVNVKFNYVVLNLYYEGIPIATTYIDHFSIMRAQYLLMNVHLVTSQVRLPTLHIRNLKKQLQSGRVQFQIKGIFKTKSRLGSLLRYSYWLYGRCDIVMTDPPSGVLVAKTCVTKR